MIAKEIGRDEIYAEMYPETQKVAREIKSLLRKENTGSLLIGYDIGALVATVTMGNEGIYGSDAVPRLAEYTAIEGGDRTLWNLMKLAQKYDRDFLKREAAIPLANGQYLNKHHFLALLNVPEEKRLEFLEKTRVNSWSVDELEAEVRGQGLVKERAPGGGRKPKPPSSPQAGLRRLTRDLRKVINYSPLMNEGVFEKIEESAPGEVDEKLLTMLEEAEQTASGAIQTIGEMIGKIEANKNRVMRVLDNKKKKRPKAA